jgi:RimJ/RimL family protein N-acetyltransferase
MIVDAMHELQIALRPACVDDAQLLFDWVNEPSSLAGKLRTNEAIDWATHVAWFESRCDSEDCQIWLAELAPDSNLVGQVRAERFNDRLEIDIFVSRESRSMGIAGEILRQAEALAKERFDEDYIFACVRHGNLASQRLFLGVGYTVFGEYTDHDLLRLDLNRSHVD